MRRDMCRISLTLEVPYKSQLANPPKVPTVEPFGPWAPCGHFFCVVNVAVGGSEWGEVFTPHPTHCGNSLFDQISVYSYTSVLSMLNLKISNKNISEFV